MRRCREMLGTSQLERQVEVERTAASPPSPHLFWTILARLRGQIGSELPWRRN